MKHTTTASISAASERVEIEERPERDMSVIVVGSLLYEGDPHLANAGRIHLIGTPLERSRFLRHMGAALFTAAEHLDRARETTPWGGAA